MASPRRPADDGAGSSRSPSLLRRLSAFAPVDVTVVHVVAAVALLALVARFVLLGDRVAHWDEARVAYWIDYYVNSGSFAYRRIIHGPFVQHVNHLLFPLFGKTDFLMRLPVAVVGGLLPLSALLFRDHLDDDETIALALFLAFNAVLLYYGRFMRSDVLVAAFMFTALGMVVRFYDTRRWRYLYGAAVFVGLGFASKENAVVYVLTWLGAGALLADVALHRPRNYDTGWEALRHSRLGRLGNRFLTTTGRLYGRVADGGTDRRADSAAGDRIRDRARSLGARLRDRNSRVRGLARYVVRPVGAVAAFLVVVVLAFAPRGLGLQGYYVDPDASQASVGLWEAVGNPALLPDLVVGTFGHTYDEFMKWFGSTSEPGCHKDNVIDGYLCFLGQYVEVMIFTAAVLTAFAIIGFLWERYGTPTTRGLVMFASYTGFVSVLGYPLGTDVFGGWIVVHAVVPLAIPAAVGVARLYRWGREATVDGDAISAVLVVVVLVLSGGVVAVTAADHVYTNSQSSDNVLVQYAQPADDVRPTLTALDRIAADHEDGTDLLVYYGENDSAYSDSQALVEQNLDLSSGGLDYQPRCTRWFNFLPMPWYVITSEADVNCSRTAGNLTTTVAEDPPPMILVHESDSTVPEGALNTSYVPRTYEMRAPGYEMTFWIHEDWIES